MNKKILLWPEGCAPFLAECAGQPEPFIEAYEVEGARGAVVVCPGGGYTHKAMHEGGPIAQMLNEAGISAYVLDYRVSPCPHNAPLSDAARAVRVVRTMGYEKVGILGFSAGGNLACNAATHDSPACPQAEDPVERVSSRPDALISCYSVVSFGAHAHVGSREKLLGENAADAALISYYSAQENVTEDTPPAFIWHTAADASVPVQNSLMLAAAYSAAKVPFELHIFPKGRHGLGLALAEPEAAQWTGLVRRWLLGQGFGR